MKNIISVGLIFCMLMTVFTVSVFATDVSEDEVTTETVTAEKTIEETSEEGQKTENHQGTESVEEKEKKQYSYGERLAGTTLVGLEMIKDGAVFLGEGLFMTTTLVIPFYGLFFGSAGLLSIPYAMFEMLAGVGVILGSPLIAIFL